jgi:hypothetical protein
MATAKKTPSTSGQSAGTRAALVLSAGAPTAPLIAGALCAMYNEGYRFDRIYTSGASALLGLMLVAPRMRIPGESKLSTRERLERKIELLGNPDIRLQQLRSIVDHLGVADSIYRFFPVGYKAFYKASPFTRLFREWASLLKFDLTADQAAHGGKSYGLNALKERQLGRVRELLREETKASPKTDRLARLYNDWIDFAASVMTPGMPPFATRALCTPFPFLEDMVDFDLLKCWNGRIYMPGYDLTRQAFDWAKAEADQGSDKTSQIKLRNPYARNPTGSPLRHRIVQFTNRPSKSEDTNTPSKSEYTNKPSKGEEQHLQGPAEFRACLAFPFIYPLGSLSQDGKRHVYIEGATQDPINEEGWISDIADGPDGVKKLFIVDTLGSKKMEDQLLRESGSLWEAYGLSIVATIVGAARARQDDLYWEMKRYNETPGIKEAEKITCVDFVDDYLKKNDLPDHIWSWNRSNLDKLFGVGQELVTRFLGKDSQTGTTRPPPVVGIAKNPFDGPEYSIRSDS